MFTILVSSLLLSPFYFPALTLAGSESYNDLPTIMDLELKAELVFENDFEFEKGDLSPVSSMAVLGPNDILLLEKNTGIVHRIINGEMSREPLLDVTVANEREGGLIGIAVTSQKNEEENRPTYVYLYFTQSSEGEDGKDNCDLPRFQCEEPDDAEDNVVYRYELKDNDLVNPQLIIKLPADPGPVHNGGAIAIGPDNNLYIAIGDVGGSFAGEEYETMAQNYQEGVEPDGRSGIIRIDLDGATRANEAISGNEDFLDKYYAYGIRNSFGLDFDPVTGNLWDTENGVNCCDEINLVEPGFNSGWKEIQGIWKYDKIDGGTAGLAINPRSDLVDFNGRGKYSPPEFIWKYTVGPTALKFLNSDKYGKEYENDLFVGSSHGRSVYHFDLDHNREELSLDGGLLDRIADDRGEIQRAIFAEGFDFITDMDIGPDGYLYILSYEGNRASVVRIVPSNIEADSRSEDSVL
jgi:aldose sugar dehydrogenase